MYDDAGGLVHCPRDYVSEMSSVSEESELVQVASDVLQIHEKLCHLMKKKLNDIPQAKQGYTHTHRGEGKAGTTIWLCTPVLHNAVLARDLYVLLV